MNDWPFNGLKPFGYGGIIADPPWQYEMYSPKGYKKSPEAHYDTMSDDEILSLPVGHLAQEPCWLFLWAIWPKLPLALECLKRWGFRHITGGAWVKRTKGGQLRWGTGYNLRSCCEPFLLARVGQAQARVTDLPNIIEARAREHSRKPDEARLIMERLCPERWLVELFSRSPWDGHDVWGHQTSMFFNGKESPTCLNPSTVLTSQPSKLSRGFQRTYSRESIAQLEPEDSAAQLTFDSF